MADPARAGHAAVRAFPEENYGPAFVYSDFVPRFRAELFDSGQSELFQQSGAK